MVKPEKKSEPVNRKLHPDEMKDSVSNLSKFNGIHSHDSYDLINKLMEIVLKTGKYTDAINEILIRLFSARFKRDKIIKHINVYVNKVGKLECCLSIDDANIYKLNKELLSGKKDAKELQYASEIVLNSIQENIEKIDSICSSNDLTVQRKNNSLSYYTHDPKPTRIYFSWDSNGIFGDYFEDDSVKMFNYLYEYQKDMSCPEYLKLSLIELLKDIMGEYIFPAVIDGFNKLMKHDGANVIIYARNAHAYSTAKSILVNILKIPYKSIKKEDLNEEMVGKIFEYPLKIKLLDNPVEYGDDKIYKKTKNLFDMNNEIIKKHAESKRKLNTVMKQSDDYDKTANEFFSKVHKLAKELQEGEEENG